MRYKLNTGFYLHSTILSAQHKNATKKQMKKKKTSERKNTQMSLIFHLFFLCLILSMASCSVKSDFHFDNPHDQKHFQIKKIIEWENKEKKADFRNEMADLYSTVK
jgi:Mn2+/Fe2+ NRAMP family transporter